MTDSDDTVARRYRELSREEPRAALDDAILAASRRAVAKPSLSRRWAAPVSIAAVLVLAFGVTLEMQREVPGIESAVPERPAPSAPTPPAKIAQPPVESKSLAIAETQVAATIEPASAAKAERKAAKWASPFAHEVESPSPAPQSEKDRFVPAAPEGAGLRRKSDSAPAAASPREVPAMPAPPADSANEARATRAPAAGPELLRDAISPTTRDAPATPQAFGAPVATAKSAAPAAPAPTATAVVAAPPPDAPAAAAPAAPAVRPSPPAFAPSPAASSSAPSAMRATAKLKAEGASSAQEAYAADPERELERIAKLREEGHPADADKALEQFRRDHPGYRIADAMWERVRPR
jgi:hypothetical protein